MTSVAGGVVGYAIGAWFYDSVGKWLVRRLGRRKAWRSFAPSMRSGAPGILIKGLTPIPYKIVTILLAFRLQSSSGSSCCLFSLAARASSSGGDPERFRRAIRAFIERHLDARWPRLRRVLVGGVLASRFLF